MDLLGDDLEQIIYNKARMMQDVKYLVMVNRLVPPEMGRLGYVVCIQITRNMQDPKHHVHITSFYESRSPVTIFLRTEAALRCFLKRQIPLIVQTMSSQEKTLCSWYAQGKEGNNKTIYNDNGKALLPGDVWGGSFSGISWIKGLNNVAQLVDEIMSEVLYLVSSV
jgi:hypothetical protein